MPSGGRETRSRTDLPDEVQGIDSGISWSRWWNFIELPRYARLAVLVAVAIALVATAVFDFAVDNRSATSYLDVAALCAIAVFAWRPALASALLLLTGALGILLGVGGPYVLALALTSGLVIFCCNIRVSVTYCSMAAIATVSCEFLDQGVAAGGVFAVGMVSGGAGWMFRRGYLREERLSADINRLTLEASGAIQAERDRIADELHDIIAHDITIVLMHTRALGLLKNAADREQSLHAIADAAGQAMTDLRRMVQIVQGDKLNTDLGVIETETIQQRIRSIGEQFSSVGVQADVVVPETLTISSSIKATLWHIANECATNIMKHAPQSPTVHLTLSSTSKVTLRIWNAAEKPGTAPVLHPSSYGLRRMSERVQLLGGSFSAGPESGGWQVEAVLPHR